MITESVCKLNQDVKVIRGRIFGKKNPLLTCGPSYWKLFTSFLSDNVFVNQFRTTIRSVSDKYTDDACVNPALKWKMVNYLTNRFQVAVRLFSNRSQMTSKCGKNKKVAYEAQPSVSLTLELADEE